MKRIVWLAAILAATVAGSSARADIIIDEFSDGQILPPVTRSTVGVTIVPQSGLSGVLGGNRVTTLTGQSFGPGDSIQFSIVTGVPGVFNYNSTNGGNGNAMLFYDGGTGNLNADLTAGGNFALAVNFTINDVAFGTGLPVTVTINDGTNEGSVTLVKSSISPPPESLMFLFSDPGFAGVNFTSVNTIKFTFEASAGDDFQLNFITATGVPAPSGIFLGCAGGLLGLGAAFRARRAKKVTA